MSHYAGLTRKNITASPACDLRSDTVTRPGKGMLEAMASAELGDDVYGEDPTAHKLEASLAELLGKQAAAFFPSGTQSNLAAVLSHCHRGEEIITAADYHVFCDEAAGASVLGGISLHPLACEADGSLTPEAIASAVKDDDFHFAISRLVCLENTVSGRAIPLEKMQLAAGAARENGLSVHLDGARFFNAVTETNCTPKELADVADSVSICLSKGLGAPVGTVLCGGAQFIARARRNRKMLGGGMRQIGALAAAGLFALEHNVKRMVEDHNRALVLANAIADIGAGKVSHRTNMVFFTPDPDDHAALIAYCARAGVLIGGQRPTIRMVTHLDIGERELEMAMDAFRSYYKQNANHAAR